MILSLQIYKTFLLLPNISQKICAAELDSATHHINTLGTLCVFCNCYYKRLDVFHENILVRKGNGVTLPRRNCLGDIPVDRNDD